MTIEVIVLSLWEIQTRVKQTLFNRLTGMHQKISNFPGVTVEKKSGWIRGENILVEDYPGTYSLQARSPDEQIVSDQIQSWRNTNKRPDAVIIVVDATNLSRNIYFALQILDMGLPTVLVLNMYDEVQRKKISVDCGKLEKLLQTTVIAASAKYGEGIEDIISGLKKVVRKKPGQQKSPVLMKVDDQLIPLQPLIDYLAELSSDQQVLPLSDSFHLVADDKFIHHLQPFLAPAQKTTITKLVHQSRETFRAHSIDYRSLESRARYAFIDEDLLPAFGIPEISTKSSSEKADHVITHPVFGSILFLFLLGFIFNAIFSWAQYPMDFIEGGIIWLGDATKTLLEPSDLRSLIIEGLIGGVGNIIVFLPQIILLVFFIGLLEDSGYMARLSFMLDGLLSRFGLSGKAVLPLLSGFACAIPAIMAARTMENRRDRFLIILLIPLISCSARLPVYTLLISALIPQKTIFGFIQLQGLVLLGMYSLGFITALMISLIIKNVSGKKRSFQYWIELPPYRIPMIRSLWWRVLDAGKKFLFNAGSIILAMSVILWFLASYPKPEPETELSSRQAVSQSFAGQLGKLLEPVIEPLGFDWKIGVGLISSFAAREVIISTFSTIYNMESADEEDTVSLREALKKDRYPDGRAVFTPLVTLSLLVFFVYAAQCMSTFAIIKKETNSWLWPFVMLVYMNVLAYLAALVVYQGGLWMGVG